MEVPEAVRRFVVAVETRARSVLADHDPEYVAKAQEILRTNFAGLTHPESRRFLKSQPRWRLDAQWTGTLESAYNLHLHAELYILAFRQLESCVVIKPSADQVLAFDLALRHWVIQAQALVESTKVAITRAVRRDDRSRRKKDELFTRILDKLTESQIKFERLRDPWLHAEGKTGIALGGITDAKLWEQAVAIGLFEKKGIEWAHEHKAPFMAKWHSGAIKTHPKILEIISQALTGVLDGLGW